MKYVIHEHNGHRMKVMINDQKHSCYTYSMMGNDLKNRRKCLKARKTGLKKIFSSLTLQTDQTYNQQALKFPNDRLSRF